MNKFLPNKDKSWFEIFLSIFIGLTIMGVMILAIKSGKFVMPVRPEHTSLDVTNNNQILLLRYENFPIIYYASVMTTLITGLLGLYLLYYGVASLYFKVRNK